ncbi:MAG: hypothetical protein MZV70_08670 [Desulfobacterales bacterium]|nr:hypothetical protein [Desulfobacterales bacterium]
MFDFDFFENLTGELSAPSTPLKSRPSATASAPSARKRACLWRTCPSSPASRWPSWPGSKQAEVQPQLGTMIKLSKALDSAFGRLVSGTGEKLYSITRKNERRAAARSTSKTGKKHLYSYKSLAPDVKGRHMEALDGPAAHRHGEGRVRARRRGVRFRPGRNGAP